MRYLMILSDVETQQLRPGDPGFEERMAAYAAFTDFVRKLGVFVEAGKLQPTAAATTVRVRDGKTVVTDGPFAETKEQFGGFYLLDCRDLDQALELAAKIPTAQHGCVEVRPLALVV
jgi:hypothetical protein